MGEQREAQPCGADETIFADRRLGRERREQALPMPRRFCRRRSERRVQIDEDRPWWLQVDYRVTYPYPF